MTPKERVLTTIAHRAPDRVPIDYAGNPGIDGRLKRHFGLQPGDDEGLRRALGVDFRRVGAPYTGPKLHADVPDRQVDLWGIHRRWIEHESGGYWDYCDFPLREATLEEVEAWPMPSPDDFDYTAVAAQCRQFDDYCVVAGGAGIPDIINSTSMLRGMEQTLVDLATDEPAGLRYIARRSSIQLEIIRRTLKAGQGAIDMLMLGEDLGTQIAPMISLDLYRRHIRPIQEQFCQLAKAHGLPVMIHCCGSSSWAFEDFIAIGIGVVDTLQPEATDMAPEYLKRRFGGRLAFHGCISTAGPVATGSVEDTVADCRCTLEIMMPGGGYCFSPTHKLQDNSPTENVVAMYETARTAGVYR
jgi:uroporphyrinogen decarboxylase